MVCISIDQTMLGDRLREFYKAAGCSRNEAIGILINLWLWGTYNANESGSLIAADRKDIAEQLMVGMDGRLNPETIVGNLIDTGWLIENGAGLNIRDWQDLTMLYVRYEKSKDAHRKANQEYRERKRKKECHEEKRAEVKENDPKDPNPKSGQSEKYGDTFDKFWSVYPRKERKAEAFKCYTARIKDGYDPEQILKAAENYAECCRRENKENRYILMARTFLGVNLNFTDYLKKAGEGGAQVVKPSSKNRFNNFEQRQYDYSAYEKQLLKASHAE